MTIEPIVVLACYLCGAVRETGLCGCKNCESRYGAVLIKAVGDPFDYVARLRSGEIVRFGQARINGEWITLMPMSYDTFADDLPYACPRGIEVRLSDIVWCADAPTGS